MFVDVDRWPPEVVTAYFTDGAVVADSDEDKPGIVFDYDAGGDLISLEILDASRRITDTSKVEFSMAG